MSIADLKPNSDPDFQCMCTVPLKNGYLTYVCYVRAEAPDPLTHKEVPGFDNMSNEGLRRFNIKMNMKSGFNNCRIQPLKMMYTDKPLELFADPSVKPVSIHMAAIIPFHFEARVKAYLDRDVCLGILEKIVVNSSVKWLSHMIVTMKKDRLPRIIINYKLLNDVIPRQTNITQSPFICASACPPKKKKTLLDPKDGYHRVVLALGEI